MTTNNELLSGKPRTPIPGECGASGRILTVFSGHLYPSVRGVRQHLTQIPAIWER